MSTQHTKIMFLLDGDYLEEQQVCTFFLYDFHNMFAIFAIACVERRLVLFIKFGEFCRNLKTSLCLQLFGHHAIKANREILLCI